MMVLFEFASLLSWLRSSKEEVASSPAGVCVCVCYELLQRPHKL